MKTFMPSLPSVFSVPNAMIRSLKTKSTEIICEKTSEVHSL